MPPTNAIKTFLSTKTFAVLGAVPDPTRYGHKVFAWYHTHNLPVVGVHPRTPELTIPPSPTTYSTIASINDLPDPANTALSFITPPPVTLDVLRTAKELGVPAVWFQPGAADQECMEFAKGAGMTVVGGGACVLVDGDAGLRSVGRL